MLTMILALLRHLSRRGRLMVLLHLQTFTHRDSQVSVWSWRLAHRVAAECSLPAPSMRVVLCVVTRQVYHVDSAHDENRDAHEIDGCFGALTSLAERTHSLLKLMPLDVRKREDYLMQARTDLRPPPPPPPPPSPRWPSPLPGPDAAHGGRC
jgi:hypothetical protein